MAFIASYIPVRMGNDNIQISEIPYADPISVAAEGFTPAEKDDIIHSNCKGCNSVCLPQHHSRQKADGYGTDLPALGKAKHVV